MTTEAPAPPDRIRECGCNPDIKCAHFNGRWVVLVERDPNVYWPASWLQWIVGIGPVREDDTDTTTAIFFGDDPDEALAAFHEAEAKMLAGDA